MNDISVRVKMGRIPALLQKLAKMQGFKTGTKAAFVHLKGKIAKYPPRRSRPQAQFWTKEQRQGFFYHLRNGNIQVPWRRGLSPKSERLAQRWELSGEGFGMTLGNKTSYANLVNGRKQTDYHKITGHKKVETVIAEERQPMRRIIFTEVKKDLAS
jgi:hypothetical protein